MPSFSLGFTQMENNERMENIENIAPITEEVEPQGRTPTAVNMETDQDCTPEVVKVATPSGDTISTPAEQMIGFHGNEQKNLCEPPFGAPTKMGRPQRNEADREDGELDMLCQYLSQIMGIEYEEIPQPYVINQWIAQSVNNDMYEVLFTYQGRVARLFDFTSLLMENEVSVGIITVWACILNHREHHNTNGSARRVFASPTTTLHTVVTPKKSRRQRLDWFCSRLATDFEPSPYKRWSDIDMVIFPIL
ncbi:uncharacterized protein LOC116014948 [Ipomoea triloba]|uniref:uncharacterized protein LOC116014948 n=1 Tax=Ipomoea triloba TaxID=35885 RepID=UPI00125E631B|nr:uncharacterized protein LOC116014948 [Ipomoea triloba]